MFRCRDSWISPNSCLDGRASCWCSHVLDIEICSEVCNAQPTLVYVYYLGSSGQRYRVPNRNCGSISWKLGSDGHQDPCDISGLSSLSKELWGFLRDRLLAVSCYVEVVTILRFNERKTFQAGKGKKQKITRTNYYRRGLRRWHSASSKSNPCYIVWN